MNRDVLSADLQQWGARLDAIWAGEPADLFDLALSDTVQRNPSMSKVPFQDMIKGMVMDVPGE
jgi:phytoene/squalene synthetase